MIKKLIIIEGTDNSGKDTLINGLTEYFNEELVDVKHFDRPKSKTNEECAKEQNESFKAFVHSLKEIEDDRIVICNRAWYGEYIYGTLYRGRTKEDVIDMIHDCENFLNENKIDTTYIQLFADSYFLSLNDDGQSLSEGKPEIIEEEGNLFKEIFSKSLIEKKLFIDVLIKKNLFKSKDDILNLSINTINKTPNFEKIQFLNI